MKHFLPFVLLLALPAAALPAWEFDSDEDLQDWAPNGHMTNVSVSEGAVHCDTIDHDPFFSNTTLNVGASHWQFFYLRVKADVSGQGQLFWSNTFEGQYGGLSQERMTNFYITGDGTWQDVLVFPYWEPLGTLVQLRLDLYRDAHFDIDTIALMEWGEDPPLTDTFQWDLSGGTEAWQVHPAAKQLLSPRLALPVADKPWVTVAMRSNREARATLTWAVPGAYHEQTQAFTLHGDGLTHFYNIDMLGRASWSGDIAVLGVLPPTGAEATVESIAIGATPQGEPELIVQYLGLEDGVNRTGMARTVLAQMINESGFTTPAMDLTLGLSEGLRFAEGSEAVQALDPVDTNRRGRARWQIVADAPGTYTVTLSASDGAGPPPREAALRFSEALNLPPADYVPAPRPVETNVDVLAYYFPGWESDGKWQCIRDVAPIRKPVLGYYDESNVECVDWQIKWARENGISCFLVDWYWVSGFEFLRHWFDAYRDARYRDQLEVAIMWANHNAEGTHSREDWRNVTQEWIDRYFNLPAYYRIDGKPAVFMWAPKNLRDDLGGVSEAAAAIAESQQMARDAGYDGITFVAVNYNHTAGEIADLIAEGYAGTTNYHEWGKAVSMAPTPDRPLFDDVAATAPQVWAEKEAASDALDYLPVADTGWDSRPWHGDDAMVIEGRSVPAFEQLLSGIKLFAAEEEKSMVVLGPLNEWGEGSYIEPCTEWDFEMYEAIRERFGVGDPADWPVNVAPHDVGLGPYDYPPQAAITDSDWTFDGGDEGWRPSFSAMANFRAEDGVLRFDYTTADNFDPVLTSPSGLSFRAADRKYLIIETSLGWGTDAPECGARTPWQFFWDSGEGMSERQVVTFDVFPNTGMHRVVVDLSKHERWTGEIIRVRVDPGTDRVNLPGHTCVIDRIAIVEQLEDYTWDFEENRTQGWCVAADGTVWAEDGALQFEYASDGLGNFDAIVHYAYRDHEASNLPSRLNFDADAYPYLRIDAALSHGGTADVPMAFHFWQDDGAIGRMPFEVTPNAPQKPHILDMRAAQSVVGEAAWAGAGGIESLRLDTVEGNDPVPFVGSRLAVDLIALVNGRGDADGDGVSDGEELDEGTDPGDPASTPDVWHDADVNDDGVIDLPELLGIIHLYAAGAYHCADMGYAPGPGATSCIPHHADYQIQDWRIDMPELMRVVQLHNGGAYGRCAGSEDGFCLGAG